MIYQYVAISMQHKFKCNWNDCPVNGHAGILRQQ